MDIIQKLDIIKAYFEKRDHERLMKGIVPVHNTDFGLWGAAGMLDAYEFFSKIELERFEKFADYGSGDGRIVLIAALFVDAVGIEGDTELHEIALEAKNKLIKEIPELERANFKCSNYYNENHNEYDMIFFFPDHPFPRKFEKELKENFEGYIIIYNQIHIPHGLKKGKTYWVQQIPIGSYPVNIEEEDLFAPTEKNKKDPAIKN